MNKSRGLNDDLKSEHKETTDRAIFCPTTDIDNQELTIKHMFLFTYLFVCLFVLVCCLCTVCHGFIGVIGSL